MKVTVRLSDFGYHVIYDDKGRMLSPSVHAFYHQTPGAVYEILTRLRAKIDENLNEASFIALKSGMLEKLVIDI